MSIFSKLKKMDTPTDNYTLFSKWLDRILKQKLPEGIVGFNFNLYEGFQAEKGLHANKYTYDIQLIGSAEIDEENEDWRCTDYFTTGEDVCYIHRTKDIEDTEVGLNYITDLIKLYLKKGKNANMLKDADAVCIGYVDGDVYTIYRKTNRRTVL